MKNIKQIIRKKNMKTNDKIENRILNGETIIFESELDKYSFFCSIVYTGNNIPFCGGNYIGNKLVLTAAHCVNQINNVNDIKIIFNKKNLFSSGISYNIKKILIHPDYNLYTSDNDIALLYLEKEPRIQPIFLPTPYLIQNNIYNIGGKDDCIIIGYGKTSMDSNLSLYLKKAFIGLLSIKDTNYPPQFLTSNMIIAGDFNDPNILDDNEDSCQGDSGGPLLKEIVYNDKVYYILIGLTSWGYGCGLEKYGGVYTKCSKYIEWIKQNWILEKTT